MINIYDRLWHVTRETDDGKLPHRRFKIPTTGLQKEVSFTEMWDYLDPIISKVNIQTVDEKEKTTNFYYDLHDDKVLAVRVIEDGKASYWLNI